MTKKVLSNVNGLKPYGVLIKSAFIDISCSTILFIYKPVKTITISRRISELRSDCLHEFIIMAACVKHKR